MHRRRIAQSVTGVNPTSRQKLLLPLRHDTAGRLQQGRQKAIFIFRSCTILGTLNFPPDDCFMIAATMANHRHVAGSSFAAQPYGVAAPFSVLMPPATTVASLGGKLGRYRIRLAEDRSDRLAACRLRFNVFNLEMGEGLSSSYSTGPDRDRFDPVCDHLIVEDQEDDQVVGTYRMQSGLTAEAAFGY